MLLLFYTVVSQKSIAFRGFPSALSRSCYCSLVNKSSEKRPIDAKLL